MRSHHSQISSAHLYQELMRTDQSEIQTLEGSHNDNPSRAKGPQNKESMLYDVVRIATPNHFNAVLQRTSELKRLRTEEETSVWGLQNSPCAETASRCPGQREPTMQQADTKHNELQDSLSKLEISAGNVTSFIPADTLSNRPEVKGCRLPRSKPQEQADRTDSYAARPPPSCDTRHQNPQKPRKTKIKPWWILCAYYSMYRKTSKPSRPTSLKSRMTSVPEDTSSLEIMPNYSHEWCIWLPIY